MGPLHGGQVHRDSVDGGRRAREGTGSACVTGTRFWRRWRSRLHSTMDVLTPELRTWRCEGGKNKRRCEEKERTSTRTPGTWGVARTHTVTAVNMEGDIFFLLRFRCEMASGASLGLGC